LGIAMDANNDYDLIVIGAGPAGEKGAVQAAYFGKRVALIERGPVGGTAVNTGTLPSKTLRETALYLSGLRQRGLYGIEYSFNTEVTVRDLIRRERDVVRNHQNMVVENIRRHNIEVFRGDGKLLDSRTVRFTRPDGRKQDLRSDFILIATGSRCYRPEGLPFDNRFVYDSDHILQLQRIPTSMIVIGAGVVGCEYATLFAALGIDVMLVDGGDRLLPQLDAEASAILAERVEALGARIILGERLSGLAVRDHEFVEVTLSSGRTISAEIALFSGGRSANTEELGLEGVGLVLQDRGRIEVNEFYQTSVPNVYAAGDVIGSPALASTAMDQARVAACHAFDIRYKQRVTPHVPFAIYTIPEVSMVGETEASLDAEGRDWLAGRAWYKSNARAQILGDSTGLIKLLFDPQDKRLLGAHIVGEQASELIHIAQACMHFGGTIDFFIDSTFNFPSLAEAYKYAAYDGLGNLERYGNRSRSSTP
jgi:NAD(P) transhydrogenase